MQTYHQDNDDGVVTNGNDMGLLGILSTQAANSQGFDWARAAKRLTSPVIRTEPWQRAWRHFDMMGTKDGGAHPYYYQGHEPIRLEDLTMWIWTPETAIAFSILLLTLTVVACCWLSHKIGEWICTAAAGFVATILLMVVLVVFVSQWT